MSRILVVDDAHDIVALLELMFHRAGFEVIAARDGQQALEQFESQAPDAVVLDLNLPLIPGWEVCRQMKQRRAIPIVIVSGNPITQMERRMEMIGADAYFGKPFDIMALLNQMFTLLGEHRLAVGAA